MLRTLLALLLPSTFLAALCAAGIAGVLAGRRAGRAGRVSLGVGAAGFVATLLLPVDIWLLRPLEDRFQPAQLPARVDGIVVLGGAIAAAVSPDRSVASLNRDGDRLTAFATLARAYPSAKLVFAGGPPAPKPGVLAEAEASKALLDGLGLAPARVLYDDQSRTTWENAVNALALAQPKLGEAWVLVTSASHMPRAVAAFRGAGWPPVLPWPVAYRTTRAGWPAPLQPVGTRLSALDLAAHEWAGLAAYRVQGRTSELLPGP